MTQRLSPFMITVYSVAYNYCGHRQVGGSPWRPLNKARNQLIWGHVTDQISKWPQIASCCVESESCLFLCIKVWSSQRCRWQLEDCRSNRWHHKITTSNQEVCSNGNNKHKEQLNKFVFVCYACLRLLLNPTFYCEIHLTHSFPFSCRKVSY